jgi:hypothetical protein
VGVACVKRGGKRNALRFLMGNVKKRDFRKPSFRWKDNINMVHNEIHFRGCTLYLNCSEYRHCNRNLCFVICTGIYCTLSGF